MRIIWSKVYRRLSLHLGKIIGDKDYRSFIVLGRSRVGSNLLNSFLNQQKQVIAHSELAGKLSGKSPKKLLDEIYCRYQRQIKAVGFKIFYYHPQDDESGAIWEDLKEIDNICVIHLKRKNILRTLLSREIAGKTNTYAQVGKNKKLDPIEKRRVNLTPLKLIEGFQQTRNWEHQFDEFFKRQKVIQITYEQLIANPDEQVQRITNEFEIDYRPVEQHLQKQNIEPLSDLIENFEELANYFKPTPWHIFFQSD